MIARFSRGLVAMGFALGLLSTPVLAQGAAQAAAPAVVPVMAPAVTPAAPAGGAIALLDQMTARAPSASHALALGVGMFGGALLGSVLLHGGALAAAVGAVAGLAVGNYVHEHPIDELD